MAATYIAGQGGDVTLATGFAAQIKSWELSIAVNTAVFSNFNSIWQNSKITNAGATGNIEGHPEYDEATLMPVPDDSGNVDAASFTGSTTLTAITGCTLSGTFNYTNVNFTRSDEAEMVMTADIELDGTLAITWDETA